MSPEFLITTLVICASPGTGVVYALAAALSRGVRAGLVASLAGTLGIVPHLAAAMLGIATLLHASGIAFAAVKYLGVLYLLYMAWQTLQQKGAMKLDASAAPRGFAAVMRDGIVLNLLNPKLSIFFVAFLPQFIHPEDGDVTVQMLTLSAVFMLVTFLVFAVYAVFAASMRSAILERPGVMAWMRRSFAAAFGLLAVKLAFTER